MHPQKLCLFPEWPSCVCKKKKKKLFFAMTIPNVPLLNMANLQAWRLPLPCYEFLSSVSVTMNLKMHQSQKYFQLCSCSFTCIWIPSRKLFTITVNSPSIQLQKFDRKNKKGRRRRCGGLKLFSPPKLFSFLSLSLSRSLEVPFTKPDLNCFNILRIRFYPLCLTHLPLFVSLSICLSIEPFFLYFSVSMSGLTSFLCLFMTPTVVNWY